MFTSRAEHRLVLRQDNADLRLMERGYEIGLIGKDRIERTRIKRALIEEILIFLSTNTISPIEINSVLSVRGCSSLSQSEMMEQILRRPKVKIEDLVNSSNDKLGTLLSRVRKAASEVLAQEVLEQVEIEIKYSGYIHRQKEEIEKFERYESQEIPEDTNYLSMKSISTEGREKLNKVRPNSIGQASRISGVSAADVSVLMVYLRQ
jgi:tRNA uridine 5-carboxymethylaminomethyl modification enzyme